MRTLSFIMGLALSVQLSAQTEPQFDSYVSSNSLPLDMPMLPVRQIAGGTKIKTTFEGNWPYEARNAFEYACKILEESIPSTFPIKLLATWNTSQANNNNFSSFYSAFFYTSVDSVLMLRSEIKGLMYDQMCNGATSTAFVDDFCRFDWSEDSHDAIITYYNYNNHIVDNCDFSISGVETGKYDFVSIAMRDIIKSLGFLFTRYEPSLIPQRLGNPNHFERLILTSDQVLSSQDLSQALTGGSFNYSSIYGDYNFYAPNPWERGKSLNYFIPGEKKLTQLLRYDFGVGSSVRDISESYTREFFREILGWKGDIADNIGNTVQYQNVSTSTNQAIPYRGAINLGENISANSHRTSRMGFHSETSLLNSHGYNISNLAHSPRTYNYVLQYHPCYNDSIVISEGWIVSMMLKDGSWDVVYSRPFLIGDLELEYDDLNFHYNDSEYARTVDGFLRCRITNRYEGRARMWHYVIDDIPQKTKMKLSKVSGYYDDEYLRTVRIGLLDIEGTDSLVVKQLDEGYSQPFYYSVPDFRKGYVEVIVDRDFTSTIQILAFNRNGMTRSDNYVISPVEPSGISLDFDIHDNEILLNASCRRMDNRNLIKEYKLLSVIDGQKVMAGSGSNVANRIPISSLRPGFYLLHVTDIMGGEHSFKIKR